MGRPCTGQEGEGRLPLASPETGLAAQNSGQLSRGSGFPPPGFVAVQGGTSWIEINLPGFGRASRSYRFVYVDEIYENGLFFSAQFQILRPQNARTQEIGGDWRRGPFQARAALFRSNVTDEIHLDPFTTGIGNINLPPSRRPGVELSGS